MADAGCNPLAAEFFTESALTGLTSVSCEDYLANIPTAALPVSNTADSGSGSLREAISNVSSGGSIDLSGTSGTISLASNLPNISKHIEIYGPCDSTVVIDGSNTYRLLRITGAATVGIYYLTLQNGDATGSSGGPDTGATRAGGGGGAGMGGALYVDGSSQVTIAHSIFYGNAATGGTGGLDADSAGGGSIDGTPGGGPAHESPAGGGINSCGAGNAGGPGTGGGGGCTDAVAPGVGFAGGNGGYGAGSGAGGSGGAGVGAPGTPGNFGGSGGSGCTGANLAAGAGGGGGAGLGGAVAVHGAGTSLTINDSTFTNNSSTGGAGGTSASCNAGAAGQGKGGAIFVDGGATISASNLTMAGNTAADQTAAANDNNNVYGFNFP